MTLEADFKVKTGETGLPAPLPRPERAVDFLLAGWRKTAEAEACFAAAFSAWPTVFEEIMHLQIMSSLRCVDLNLESWKSGRFEDLKKAIESGQLP